MYKIKSERNGFFILHFTQLTLPLQDKMKQMANINVTIEDAKVREAAAAGMDEFVNLFADAVIDSVGGQLTEEAMGQLNADQITLVAFKYLHDEVMDGGFVQLIYNGFGPFIFFNPFAKAVREWGLDNVRAIPGV